MVLAITGCFGIATAQVEQTPPQNSGSTNQNQSTTPNTQNPTKRQGNYQNQGTSTTTPQGTYENQGTTITTPQGTYEKQGTSTTTPQGTYENSGTGTPNMQGLDTMKHTQGTMNKDQGTMNKRQGTMNKAQGTWDKTQSSMSQDEKGWTKIGEKAVNMSKNREEIAVTGAEKFSSIKIKVPQDAKVDLKDVVVEYEGGTKQKVDMSTAVNSATGESQVIELNSSDRNVKKISFAYEPREENTSMSTPTSKNITSTSKSSTSKGKMSSSTTKGTQGTSERKEGMMGSSNSKSIIEVWGLKADTALR
jgi:hypothetical protein